MVTVAPLYVAPVLAQEAAAGPRTCTVGDCRRPVDARDMCNAHYLRHLRGADLSAPLHPRQRYNGAKCLEPECEREARSAGRCMPCYHKHRARVVTDGSGCRVPDCNRAHYGRGLCRVHHARDYRTGSTDFRGAGERYQAGQGCQIPGCRKPHKARGFCSRHEQLQRLYGDPLGSAPPPHNARPERKAAWEAATVEIREYLRNAMTAHALDDRDKVRFWVRRAQEVTGRSFTRTECDLIDGLLPPIGRNERAALRAQVVTEMDAAGKTTAEIAARLDVDVRTVHRIRAAITGHAGGDPRRDEMIRLKHAGHSYAQIAAMLGDGLTKDAVAGIIRRAHLKAAA